MSSPVIVQVAVFVPLGKTFSYLWPSGEPQAPRPGLLLRVPFGPRTVFGCVLGLGEGESGDGLREVREIVDPEPLFSAAMAAFFERIARYYHHPIGEVVGTAVPPSVFARPGREPASDPVYAAVEGVPEPPGSRQRRILEWLQRHGATSRRQLNALFPGAGPVLKRLTALGAVAVEASRPGGAAGCGEDNGEAAVPPLLTAEQNAALEKLAPALAGNAFAPFLLHGVTGSGKTEVYLRAAEEARRRGKKILILVPEIALTPQLVERFRQRLGGEDQGLAVLHSGLSNGDRRRVWKGVRTGRIDLVIGARSAVFVPFDRVGLIIVDEEHEAGYKQSEGFRYNARDLALWRGQIDAATVILGSATPSLATFCRARQGKIGYLPLPCRVLSRPLPEVTLVDLSGRSLRGCLSPELIAALGENLEKGEQSLLLLNRRGFSPFLLCQDCGTVIRCPRCEISMTFYRRRNLLRCHYCDSLAEPPETCPHCRGTRLQPCGAGTERLEEELAELFPAARLARMDSDSMTRKDAYPRMVERMRSGEVDILVGTQMVAKGHDFARITLVGVVDADATLFLPDFRSVERAFSLLTQVSGRAGRGVLPGRVLIQTRNPGHYVFDSVIRHDYESFFEQEAGFRRDMGYPPFGHLANIVVSGEKDEAVEAGAATLAAWLQGAGQQGVEVLGPSPCLLARLRGKRRVQILLKAAARPPLHRLLERLDRETPRLPGMKIMVDVDPVDMF